LLLNNGITPNISSEVIKTPKVKTDLCMIQYQRKNIFELRIIVE
jgi:hypothetical protein